MCDARVRVAIYEAILVAATRRWTMAVVGRMPEP